MKQQEEIYDAREVANEVIRLALLKPASITNLKVLKLIYFCNAFMLGIGSGPMFFQPVIAWKYGPVVLDVYHALKHNGAQDITSPIRMPGLQQVEGTTKEIIGETYGQLGSLPASRLLGMSHDVNGPWYKTWNNSLGQDQVIPNETMQEYFSSFLG